MFYMVIENEEERSKVEKLYYRYRQLMYREAYMILNDQYLAEESVHESFVRIINNLHKMGEEDCPRTRNFLVIICRNVAKDFCREKTALNKQEDLPETLCDPACCEPEKIVVSKETIARIAEVIGNLQPIYKDVFLLKRVYGFTREEIAKTFGLSVETVKKRLYRAKVMILKSLEESEAE